MEGILFEEKDFLACCRSTQFAKEMVSAAPFTTYEQAVDAARDIWFNKELSDWNSCYRQKFGFVFLIFASGRSTPEILAELKRRYRNRPLVEFEIAAGEQMKVTELCLAKLFSTKAEGASATNAQHAIDVATKAGEDCVNIIGAHLATSSDASVVKPTQIPARTRPPITTHVLDVARGSPGAGIEVKLEMWRGNQLRLTFGETEMGNWVLQGSSTTDKDGRSGQLMRIVDALKPGVYRISFNTGKYSPGGFFPYVAIVFEVRESQKWEHGCFLPSLSPPTVEPRICLSFTNEAVYSLYVFMSTLDNRVLLCSCFFFPALNFQCIDNGQHRELKSLLYQTEQIR